MAFKNIMVTGARGMLGSDLVPYLAAKGYNVFPATSDYFSLLETRDVIHEKVAVQSPELIIHCAGYTNVDGAEKEPELAMAVNKDGTRKLAQVAGDLEVPFIYISTDYVFDGLKNAPYLPDDRPNPVNTYGLSKYYGELMVSELLDMYYIVRVSWLYGIHKNNFVQFVLDSARQGSLVKAATDSVGSPTWTGSVAMWLETIMNSGAYGTYHAVDQGALSRYEQAMAMCHLAGFSAETIRPVESRELPWIANRPHYSALAPGELAVPSWETSFMSYLELYKNRLESHA